jgi:two-component system LytT family response regulator
MRVLIVDDEPLARSALLNILSTHKDVSAFESASDAVEALEKLKDNFYDVLLLDINMPELSGIGLVDCLRRDNQLIPSIVFVTAHHEHAIAAFEKQAVDYVLKPFSNERISQALEVAFQRTAGERAMLVDRMLKLQMPLAQKSSRIAIKTKGRILFVDTGDIVAVEAQGNYVLLHRQSGSDLLRESISAIAEKFKTCGFIRVHRSVLVNTSFVEEIEPWVTGEYLIRVKGGKQYTASRTYKKNLKSIADFWVCTSAFD